MATGFASGPEQTEQARLWRWFVGDISPRGHMLPLLVGASRLVQAARQAGAQVVVYDTCGLIDPSQGGLNLKLAKIALLQPSAVVALQRGRELEPLLEPLRRSPGITLYELPVSPAAQERTHEIRRSHRAQQYAAYFTRAALLSLQWTRLAVLPKPSFHLHQVAALTDSQGFAIGLGIIQEIRAATHEIGLWTPVQTLARVHGLQLGDVLLDTMTMQDQRLRLT
jgi:polynucleotide 5'-hydroxyl-kinase GRC3/NOL9